MRKACVSTLLGDMLSRPRTRTHDVYCFRKEVFHSGGFLPFFNATALSQSSSCHHRLVSLCCQSMPCHFLCFICGFHCQSCRGGNLSSLSSRAGSRHGIAERLISVDEGVRYERAVVLLWFGRSGLTLQEQAPGAQEQLAQEQPEFPQPPMMMIEGLIWWWFERRLFVW